MGMMLISVTNNLEAGNGLLWAIMGFLQLSIVVIIPIWMFSTSVFLLFVRLIFVFVLFSFLIFVFGKMYLM